MSTMDRQRRLEGTTKMKFDQLLKKLKQLNLPEDQYAIFGSGPMAVRGLKEAKDVDLVVTQKLYDALKQKYTEIKPGQMIIDGVIEICSPDYSLVDHCEEVIKHSEMIDGFRFMRLDDLLKWKREMGRDKDYKDIKIIEKYLM